MILATPDRDDPNGMEELEYEYHRLLSIAEAYTGCEKMRLSLPPNLTERVAKLQAWIQQERELMEIHLVPYTIENMAKKVRDLADKDDWQTGGEFKDYKEYERLQSESKGDQSGD